MSSVSGGGFRGRGRGSTTPKSNAMLRTTSNAQRGRANTANNRRGNNATRGLHGSGGRGGSQPPSLTWRANGPDVQNTTTVGGAKTHGDWQERYQILKQLREKERADAIRRGLIADPDKPRALADAITPVGTCQDMCPEYDRVMRVVQKDVWDEETDPNHSAFARGEPLADESRMVKKFRRSAAGNDEQLPSDLRPPLVLKKTCDYLFHDLIGNSPSLAKVHHFVWDRTRAIRNDFSIQQLTKAEDLRIAIECYERIARFHIVSLHILALPEKPYDKYDAQQEREQLDRTLLSLMQYYDDCRDRFQLANEAEFRAYTIVFQLSNPVPDLEYRLQNWPLAIAQNPRVRKALDIYTAACNTFDVQGPLKPETPHVIARQDWERFWQIVSSSAVSYLMACVAEVYFTLVRRMTLRALFRTSSKKSAAAKATSGLEWSIDELWDLFNFDDESELIKFCERFGFAFRERDEDGQLCLDLGSVPGRNFPEPAAGVSKQSKSSIVEDKRHRRSLPAIIDGMNVRQAVNSGLIVAGDDDNMKDITEVSEQSVNRAVEPQEDEDSLFMPETEKTHEGLVYTPTTSTTTPALAPASVDAPISSTFGMSSVFGQPSISTGFSFVQTKNAQMPQSTESKQAFSFLSNPKLDNDTEQTPSESTLSLSTDGEVKPSTSQPVHQRPFFSFAPTSNASPLGGLFKSDVASTPVSFEPPAVASGRPDDDLLAKSGLAQGSSSPSRTPFGPGIFASTGGLNNPFSTTTDPVQDSPFTSASTLPEEKTSVLAQSATSQKSATLSSTYTSNQQSSISSTFAQSSSPVGNLQGSLSQNEATAKSSQPSVQSQLTSSAQITSASPASQVVHSNAPNLRRQSVNDWKPKTPSKLSNSFTVNNDGSPPKPVEASEMLPASKIFVEPLPDNQGSLFKATTLQAPPSSSSSTSRQPPSLDSILNRLAQELTFDPIAGFMKQYVDFSVSRVVTEIQESIYHERVNKEADEFRQFCLASRYGRKWRNICRHQRLFKQGRERRQRAQRRLHQSIEPDATEGMSRVDNASVQGDSRAASFTARFETRQEEVDAMFQSTLTNGQSTRDALARINNKRPAISNSRDAHVHKRLRSNDTAYNFTTAIATQPSRPGKYASLQRSSFLGFSLPSSAPNHASTTKSPYFRMKALGIELGLDKYITNGSKRPRSGSLDVSMPSKLSKFRRSSVRSSPEHSHVTAVMASSSTSPPARLNAEDEALFARLKAAREGLRNGTDFMKSDFGKERDFGTSTGSASSSDSPSMVLARAEARRNAAQAEEIKRSGRDVPAYRLRESRFVPRDSYSHAIARSKEIRASRSHESSRPGSGLGQHPTINPLAFPTIATNVPPPKNSGAFIQSDLSDDVIQPDSTATSNKSPRLSQSSFRMGGRISQAYSAHAPHAPSPESFTKNSTAQLNFISNTGGASEDMGSMQREHKTHTIVPTQVPSALSDGFRRPEGAASRIGSTLSSHQDGSAVARFACEEQSQPSSHRHSNGVLGPKIHGYPNLPRPYGDANPFAVLADEDAEDKGSIDYNAKNFSWNDEAGLQDEGSDGDEPEDGEGIDRKEWVGSQNGHDSEEEEEGADIDGDVEDYTDEDPEDEDGSDSDPDDEEEEADAKKGRYFIQPRSRSPAVEEGPGNNAEEPIELSD